MQYPQITHHGGVASVTGSCHELQMDEHYSLLIDCGALLESVDGKDPSAVNSIQFALDTIKALVLTHVHADHVGRIPELLAAGYTGPILCSEPSAHLLPVVLQDAFSHQFGRSAEELDDYLTTINKRIVPLPFDRWFTVVETDQLVCSVRLQRAGHILGSAYVEFDINYPLEKRNKRVVFSGDLGSSHTPFLPGPKSPERADILVLESTYGDRLHEDRASRQQRLEAVIDQALADNGTVLIPAFSIGRTQELLYEIEDILRRKVLADAPFPTNPEGIEAGPAAGWSQLPVILDSPLAASFTRIYRDFNDYWDAEAQERLSEGRRPLAFGQLITIDSHDKHLQVVNYLSSTKRPAIVIAGHGMCAGGRIVNYLKAMLGDSRHNVIFVGYQVKGTPGAAIQKYGPQGGYVELDRERFAINAGVTTVGGYSAHADQGELIEFVTGMSEWPTEIRLVHGEINAKKTLGASLNRKYAAKKRAVMITS
ncbi:MBL fold metallo-hydrolase [Pseudomonas sp. G.S.17]|uniref:MBL fold metallo-hydrolase n=1 Tax=Pseudomonas sp. G.S.17 TaxID=3137451 RepID=UPI00311CC6C4